MKNKGISLRNICFSAWGLGVLLTIIRIYQSLVITDGSTGFFTESNISVPLMYILAAVTVIIPLVLTYICSDKPSGEIRRKPSFIYIFSVIFFAASLILEGVKKVLLFIGTDERFDLRKEAVGGNVGFLVMIFSIFAAISLLLSLVVYIKKGTLTGKLKIPMLFPAIWAFLKTLGFFSVTVSYVKVVSLLLTIFAFSFLMVFLFQTARVSTGIGRKESVWIFFATGLISAALCFSAGIPSLIAHFFMPEKEVLYCPYDLNLITAGLYAVAAVASRLGVTEENTAAERDVTSGNNSEKNNDVTENG